MSDKFRKINICNRHFANINRKLYEEFMDKTAYKKVADFVRKQALEVFGINISSVKDVDMLISKIKEIPQFNNANDWLQFYMRSEIGMNRIYIKQIDDMLSLEYVKTKEDVKKYREMGFNVVMTCQQFHQKFPLLDVSKVMYDNTFLANTVYYDAKKFAMIELYGGFEINKEQIPDNYTLLNPSEGTMSAEEAILKKVDFIYSLFKKGDYEFFTYLNFPLYRNEIIDKIISETDDKQIISKLTECQRSIN